MRNLTLAALTLVAASASASPGWFANDCDNTAPRSAAVSAAGATRIVIIGRAGTLRVTGAGGSEVRAAGTACSSDRNNLARIVLTATRSGSEVRVEAKLPESDSWMSGGTNALDFEVTVPAGIPLRIDDTSGEMWVEGVGPSDIHDTSGALHVRNVSGDLAIDDTSGEIIVEHVSGHVTIEDSSGSIDVADVGSLDIPSDGSGAVDIRNVKRDVTIGSKGSGSISVSDVGGNLTVRHKGSGGIEVERVAGRVDVPRRD